MADDERFLIAADLASLLAAKSYASGTQIYAPQWYRRSGPHLGLGDCGARAAIESGDINKMREAMAELNKMSPIP